MAREILNWEAGQQIEEAIIDGLSDEQLQKILDIIYGSNMFRVIDKEELKKTLFEDKKIFTFLNKSE